MGPVACVSALAAAQGDCLGPAIASVAEHLAPGAGTGSLDAEWAVAVANAATDHLDRPGAAAGPHGGALLSLASRAIARLRAAPGPGARSPAASDALQYSLIRKLVGRGAHAAALGQGWELYARRWQRRAAAAAAAQGPARRRRRRRRRNNSSSGRGRGHQPGRLHRRGGLPRRWRGRAAGRRAGAPGGEPAVGCARASAAAHPHTGVRAHASTCMRPPWAPCAALTRAARCASLRRRARKAAAPQRRATRTCLCATRSRRCRRWGPSRPRSWPPAAPGLPALLAGALQACALSSQPGELPQVLARACSFLPPDAGCCALEALLALEGGGGGGAPAAARLARGRPGGRVAGAAAAVCAPQGPRGALGGAAGVAHRRRRRARLRRPRCRGAGAAGRRRQRHPQRLAAGCASLQELLAGASGSSSSAAKPAAKARGRCKGAADDAGSDGSADEGARTWLLSVADACLDQLQQATAAAAAGGAPTGWCVEPSLLADALRAPPRGGA